MNIVIINGPNLNLLGKREPDIYGTLSYQQLCEDLQSFALDNELHVSFFQSNHEGALVDFIQLCPEKYDAIVINAAAYTHTSIAILDALSAVQLPTVEVHLSNIDEREEFRKISYIRQACLATFFGEGIESYKKALLQLKLALTQKQ